MNIQHRISWEFPCLFSLVCNSSIPWVFILRAWVSMLNSLATPGTFRVSMFFLGFFSTFIPLVWQIQNSPETWTVRMSMLNLLFSVRSFYVNWQGCKCVSHAGVHCTRQNMEVQSQSFQVRADVGNPMAPLYPLLQGAWVLKGDLIRREMERDFFVLVLSKQVYLCAKGTVLFCCCEVTVGSWC